MEAKNMKGGMMAINTWFKPLELGTCRIDDSDKLEEQIIINKTVVSKPNVIKKSVKQASISSWVSDGVMVEEQSPVTSKKKGTVKQVASNKGQAKITKFFENTEE